MKKNKLPYFEFYGGDFTASLPKEDSPGITLSGFLRRAAQSFTLLLLMMGMVVNGWGQVTLPGTSPYTEDFNTTPGASGTTYPTGWVSYNSITADNSMTVGTSSSNSGANYNYGSRIGLLGSGSAFNPGSIVLAITNTTGKTGLKISYDIIKIREQGRDNSFNLETSTTSATSGFTTVTGGGYSSGTIVEGTVANYSNVDISVLDNKSGTVWIRWYYADIGGSGSRDGIALDNVSLSWNTGCQTAAITTSPSNQSTPTTSSATFTATGTGDSWQWQENVSGTWNDITDGGVYSGATTASLTITNPSIGMDGYQYRTVISQSCNASSATSGDATLTVTTPPPAPANDLCGDAEGITLGAAAVSGTLVAATYATPFTSMNDVWYSFTPTCTGTHTITVTGFTGDVDVEVYNQANACPTTTTDLYSAATTNTTETITDAFTKNTTYYVRVLAYDAPAENSTFTIGVTAPTPATAAVTTDAASSVMGNSATLNGTIATLGVCPASMERGFVYSQTSLNSNPIDGGTSVTTLPVSGTLATGAFFAGVGALALSTSYTYKAYLKDEDGVYTYGASEIFTTTAVAAPDVIAIQDFESSPATPTWSISAGASNISTTSGSGQTPANQSIRNGLRSWQVSNNNSGAILNLSAVSVSGYTSVQAIVYISSTSGTSGNGADAADQLKLSVNVDGVGFPATPDITVSGNGNARWGYNTSGTSTTAGTPVSVVGAAGTNQSTIYSKLVINIPDGSSTVALKIVANNNSADEFWNVDDITLTGFAAPPSTTYYPLTNATDLAQTSNWTTDVNGNAGTAPADFTSPNQAFVINNNVTNPIIAGDWTITNGAVQITNTGDVTLAAGKTLTIGTGATFDMNSKHFILQSNTSATAAIGKIDGTLSGATNVTVERYIPAKRAWRQLAVPFASSAQTIYDAWQEGGNTPSGYGTWITAPTPNVAGAGTYDANSTGTSLSYYDGSAFTTPSTTNIPITDHGGAYFLFVRGDRTVQGSGTANNTTLRMNGTLNQGNVTTGVSGTDFTFVPNPYASPIDYDAVVAANPSLTTFYVWDARGQGSTGGYRAVEYNSPSNYTVTPSGGIATPNDARFIQSGQAFFIPGSNQTHGAANISFTESMKASATSSTPVAVFKTTSGAEEMVVNLTKQAASGAYLADGIRIKYDAGYSNAVTAEDIKKLVNPNDNLSVYHSSQDLVVDKMATPTQDDTVQLRFWNPTLSNYEFSFEPSSMSSFSNVYLLDNYLNTATALSTSSIATYNFSVTSAAGSYDPLRFAIVFKVTPLQVSGIELSGNVKEKTARLTWKALNEHGVKNYSIERSADAGKLFTTIATTTAKANDNSNVSYSYNDADMKEGANLYRVKSMGVSGNVVYSNILSLSSYNGLATDKGISIFPNPVKGNTMNIQFSNLADGAYDILVYSLSGALVHKATVSHTGVSGIYAVSFGKMPAAGVYNVSVVNVNTGASYKQQMQVQ